MASKALPSPEVLRQLLRYEPKTGKLFWRERGPEWFKSTRIWASWNTQNANMEALNVPFQGYLRGGVLKKQMLAHRAIWAMQTGEWPVDDIDHINGIRDDNRMENLRHVTRAENLKNVRRRDNNTSGFTGVSFHKASGLWRSRIMVNGREVVRCFPDIATAASDRAEASRKHGYHENHGRTG